MKKLFLYLCLPFFLPVLLVAFLAAANSAGHPIALGMADLLDLSALADKAGIDLEFLLVTTVAALVVQLVVGIMFIREVLSQVPTVGKAIICSLIGVTGVTLLVATAVAFVVGVDVVEAICYVAGGFGLPAFFGSLIAWRLLHPTAWVEPSFPQ